MAIPGNTRETGKLHLPHRDALATDIKFWKKIFAELSLDQYLIHDSQDLSIMYKIVAFDSSVSARKREKELQKVKDEIKELLLKFHSGNFAESQLNAWERSVYQQFAGIKDRNKFLEASKRIRTQQGIRENFMAGIKRSYAYLQYIEELFKKEGIPVELKYLPHVESSFDPAAKSHVGAAGMWQFMRSTGRLYMKVNRTKDERFDPIASTRAAARLLKYNYEELQDWALAITAYNHGLGSMRKAKRKFGSYMKIRENYLRRSFGFASKNFYPEFLAVVEIADSIDHYFPGLEKDPLIVFQEIELPAAVSLPRLAKKYRIDMNALTSLNPGFRRHIYNGAGNVPAGYTLRLPLTADASQILTSLGASRDEIREITLVQKTPDREKLVIGKVKDFQMQKKAAEEALALKRIGVESVYQNQQKSIVDPERLALIEPETPATATSPITMTETLSALNAVPVSLLPNDSYSPLNKPGVEERPNQRMAAIIVSPNLTDKTSLPTEVASTTPANFELAETSSSLGQLAVSKPGVAVGPEDGGVLLTPAGAFAEPPVTDGSLAVASMQPSAGPEKQTPAISGAFAAAALDSAAVKEMTALLALGDSSAFIRGFVEKSTVLSFNKYRVEAQMTPGLKLPQVLPAGEALTVRGNLYADRLASNSLAGAINLPAILLEKPGVIPETVAANRIERAAFAYQVETAAPAIAQRPAEFPPELVDNALKGETIRFAKAGVEIAKDRETFRDNDFAFALTAIEAAAEQPVSIAQTTATQSLAVQLASTPAFAWNFSSNDSLLWTESRKQAVEPWLTSLKPGVKQSRQNLDLPTAAFVSANEAENSAAGGTYAYSSIDFNKQSVESNISYNANDNSWMAVFSTREEFTLEELAGILRRRLNSEKDFIHVYPQETLGHYSEWLNISTYQLRRLNNISRNQKIYTGQQFRLDFSHVTPAEFLEKRMGYHLNLISKQLKGHNKIRLIDHTINSGENLWSLAHKRYNFPVNLLLYFNDFDKLGRLYPGDVIKLPVIYN